MDTNYLDQTLVSTLLDRKMTYLKLGEVAEHLENLSNRELYL